MILVQANCWDLFEGAGEHVRKRIEKLGHENVRCEFISRHGRRSISWSLKQAIETPNAGIRREREVPRGRYARRAENTAVQSVRLGVGEPSIREAAATISIRPPSAQHRLPQTDLSLPIHARQSRRSRRSISAISNPIPISA